MESYCVYKHTSPSGKVYIGITKQTPNDRWKQGNGYQSSPHFWNAIQKYGWKQIEHEVLKENLSIEDACRIEQELIKQFDSMNPAKGYNEKAGGERGSYFSEELKKRHSERMRSYYEQHPEERAKRSERATGYRQTDEAKAKMSASKKGRTFVQTPEWRKHIGEANKARMQIDSNYYESAVNQCRSNGLKSAKGVIQFDLTGKEIARFESAHNAQRVTGISNGNIGRCCRGLTKSAGGYKWRYAV